jgi:uncharacterized protein
MSSDPERTDDLAIGEDGVEVPYTRLAADVLRRVAEEFVTRDGTDYGAAEKSLEAKVADVTTQLERGDAAIVFDAASGTINVVSTRLLAQGALRSSTRAGQRSVGVTNPMARPTSAIEAEVHMGDRSPKSKQRAQHQKVVSKATDAAAAKSKQDAHSHAPLTPKDKRQ